MAIRAQIAASAVLALLVSIACAPPGRNGLDDPGQGGQGGGEGDPGGPDGGAGSGGGGSGGGPGGTCSAGSSDLSGCACDNDGQKRECGSSVGACKPGEQVCHKGAGTVGAGAWGPCTGGAGPGDEKCYDGVDNDCNGKADCDDPKCNDYCKWRDGGADAPPPSATCPCDVKTCDSIITCGHPPYQVCTKGVWSRCRSFNYCTPEALPKGKTDECQGHLDCPKKMLCDTGGMGTINKCITTTDPQFKWPDPSAAVTCDADTDCAGACKFSGACKCHSHGLCIKDCVSGSDCPAGAFCNIITMVPDPKVKGGMVPALVGLCQKKFWTDCSGKKVCE